eukprot:3921292-Pyramimonas_sp.AAC.1
MDVSESYMACALAAEELLLNREAEKGVHHHAATKRGLKVEAKEVQAAPPKPKGWMAHASGVA